MAPPSVLAPVFVLESVVLFAGELVAAGSDSPNQRPMSTKGGVIELRQEYAIFGCSHVIKY